MYKISDEIFIETSKDGLKGYITILNEDNLYTEDNMKKIKEYFKYGLNDKLTNELLKKQDKVDKVLIAEGRRPINGKNGYIDYKFELNKVLLPKISEDGTVDYRELDSINKVSNGDILATIVPPSRGIEGKKVTGETILYKKGKLPKFKQGKNTVISEDGKFLRSIEDGLVEVKSGRINVLKVLHLDEVDNRTGNIDFNGNIIIKKDILNGFTVRSQGSVEVRGAVEGGYINCTGDVLIRRGIQGYNRLVIENDGNLSTKFIENSHVDVGGNITSESIMHSNVVSKSNILLLGKNGLIVGGVCRANHEIVAKVIGSIMATKTIIEVGIDPRLKDQQNQLEHDLEISSENLEKLNKALTLLERLKKANKLNKDKYNLYNDLLKAKESTYLENKKIKNNLLVIKEKINRLSNGKIKVSDTIYPGSKIVIGNSYLNIRRKMHNCTFYSEKSEIRIGAY